MTYRAHNNTSNMTPAQVRAWEHLCRTGEFARLWNEPPERYLKRLYEVVEEQKAGEGTDA